MTECANDDTQFQGDEPTPDQLRAAAHQAHQALQALQKTQNQDSLTALDTEDDRHALRNAYRECERLARRLGAPPNEDEREPPPWFLLAARNLTHGPETPDAAVLLAATIAASTDGSPPTGTRYSNNGSAAITWDHHHLRIDIRVQPHEMPTFDLQRFGKARHRGYVHRHAQMLRTALAEHQAEAQS